MIITNRSTDVCAQCPLAPIIQVRFLKLTIKDD